MKFYNRYMAGETRSVYKDILDLGENAFLPEYLPDIEKVLTETFTRAAFNLEVIYNELKAINYLFRSDFVGNFERPLHLPLPGTDSLLDKLDDAVHYWGYVPLSLKFFHSIVGGVNFSWDYETDEYLIWEMSDPLQIMSLDELVDEVTDEGWEEEMQERMAEDGVAYLELAPDAYHKDNISGGPAYSIHITKTRSVDSLFLYEPHNTTFIDYLRLSFEHCGFPGLAKRSYSSYSAFCETVKPKLLKI